MSPPSLRNRIRNGTLLMLAIALVAGMIALPKVYRLGGAIRPTLYRNYVSIEAAQHMHAALSAVRLAQRDGAQHGGGRQSRRIFALDRVELADITEVGEHRWRAISSVAGRVCSSNWSAGRHAAEFNRLRGLHQLLDDLVG